MRRIRGLPKYSRQLRIPYGKYGDETITAESISTPVQEILNNTHFLMSKVERLKDKLYGIPETSTTTPPTTNINQVPVRLTNIPAVYLGNTELSKIITLNYNRQTYTTGNIKFRIINADDGLAIGTYVHSVKDDSFNILIQRTGDFYGYGSFTLELLDEAGVKLNSALISVRCDPLTEILRDRFSRSNSWFPALPLGTQSDMVAFIYTPPTYNLSLATRTLDELKIPVTISGISSVKVTVFSADSRISVSADKEYMLTSEILTLRISKVGFSTGGTNFEVRFEGISAAFGYVAYKTMINIKLSEEFEFSQPSNSTPDLSAYVELEDYNNLRNQAYDYNTYRVTLEADSNGTITIPSYSIVVALRATKPIRFDKIAVGLSKFVSDTIPFVTNNRPDVVTLERVTQSRFSTFSEYTSYGNISYYVGIVPTTKITLPKNSPAGTFRLDPEIRIITPTGLGTVAEINTSTYKFFYKK